jgi:hypothetical protein
VTAFSVHPHLPSANNDLPFEAWRTVKQPLEAFLYSAEDTSNQLHLASETGRRRQVLEIEYVDLAFNHDTAKAANLFPLPCYTEFRELESVKALYAVETVEDSYADDPKLIDHSEEIARELRLTIEKAKKDIVERLIAVHTEVVQRQATTGSSLPSSTTSSAALTTSLIPTPTEGVDYSASEIDAFLLRTVAVVQCNNCRQIDIFPRLLTHTCTNYICHRPSFSSKSYTVSVKLCDAALKVIELANESLEVSAPKMDELGRGFSCDGGPCDLEKCTALPWWLMVSHCFHLSSPPVPSSFTLVADPPPCPLRTIYRSIISSPAGNMRRPIPSLSATRWFTRSTRPFSKGSSSTVTSFPPPGTH